MDFFDLLKNSENEKVQRNLGLELSLWSAASSTLAGLTTRLLIDFVRERQAKFAAYTVDGTALLAESEVITVKRC